MLVTDAALPRFYGVTEDGGVFPMSRVISTVIGSYAHVSPFNKLLPCLQAVFSFHWIQRTNRQVATTYHLW